LTAGKEKEEMRSNKIDARPPTSTHLPSSVATAKKENFNKTADDKTTAKTELHSTSSHYGGFRPSQNASAFSVGSHKHGDKTSAAATTVNSQPVVEQTTWNRTPNTGVERVPQVEDKTSASLRAGVNQQSTDWKAKEENEKRLRDKEEQLRILQVLSVLSFIYVLIWYVAVSLIGCMVGCVVDALHCHLVH